MYFNLIDKIKIKNFLFNRLDYEEIADTKIHFEELKGEESSNFIVSRCNTITREKEVLGRFSISDFTCFYVMNTKNNENEKLIKENGNNAQKQYSKLWRSFVVKELEYEYGDFEIDKADLYIEDFYDTELGNINEYNKLKEMIELENEKDKVLDF